MWQCIHKNLHWLYHIATFAHIHFIMEKISSIVCVALWVLQPIKGNQTRGDFIYMLSATLIPHCSHSQTNLEKVKKLTKGCTKWWQLQLYSHTFGQQCKCCQINVVALDTRVGTYLLFMFRLIQTSVQWVSDKLCVVISIFRSSTSPALVSGIGCAVALSCFSVTVRLSHLAQPWYTGGFFSLLFFPWISHSLFLPLYGAMAVIAT